MCCRQLLSELEYQSGKREDGKYFQGNDFGKKRIKKPDREGKNIRKSENIFLDWENVILALDE